MAEENKMREVRVSKVTLNIGAGTDPNNVKKAVELLSAISNKKAIETKSRKRIAGWKIRPGLPIGSKVTIRGKAAEVLLKRLLAAVNNNVKEKNFTEGGFSFGIPEYIDIPDVRYDPKIGIIGLEACVTLDRAGYRVTRRKLRDTKIPKSHRVLKEDAIRLAKVKFGVSTEDEKNRY